MQSNPRDGVSSEGSQVTIINSTVRQNGRIGVFIATGTSGRIGLDTTNNAAGNTITPERRERHRHRRPAARRLIGNNSITFNGTDPASTAGRSGHLRRRVRVADIIGGNTIADNAGAGRSSSAGASVPIGSTAFPLYHR